ncbi:MAG: hypothetical protein ACJ8BF_10370 [Gemmatimonadales bacterium]
MTSHCRHPEPFDSAQGRLREPAMTPNVAERLEESLGFGSFATLRMTPLLGILLFVGCASPEAGRARGHAGADVKNWGRSVELHAGAQPYHDTPCVTEPVECHGPPPVFGLAPPPD